MSDLDLDDDLGDVPEELQPDSGSDAFDTLVVVLLGVALMLVYVGAAAVWPGGPAVWVSIGFAIWAAAFWRVFGPPWGSS